jgi:hypothetical protein
VWHSIVPGETEIDSYQAALPSIDMSHQGYMTIDNGCFPVENLGTGFSYVKVHRYMF